MSPLSSTVKSHVCDRCRKRFSTAAHLARHEKSHSGEGLRKCEICGKVFSRTDSLTRHLRLHDDTASSSRADSCTSPAGPILQMDQELKQPLRHGPSPIQPQIQLQGQSQSYLAHSESFGLHSTPSSDVPSSLDHGPIDVKDVKDSTLQSSAPYVTYDTHDATATALAETLDADVSMDTMHGLGLTVEEAELWDLLSHDLLPETVNINAQENVNTLDWDLSQFALDTFPSITTISKFEPPSSMDTPPQIGTFQPDIEAASSSQQPQPSMTQNLPTQPQETTVAEQAVSAANDLMHSLSNRVRLDTSTLSSNFLDLCLHTFRKRFLPVFPVIHEATFDPQLASPTLLINMMVLGTLAMNQSEARHHGDAMWRLVHKGVMGTWDRLIEMRGPYDDCQGVPLILTALLGQLYGLNSANPEMIRNSLVANHMNFRWARTSGIYDNASVPNKVDVRNLEGKALEHAWKLWSAKETQRRGILGCYVLDAITGVSFDTTLAVRHTYNPFPALADEDTFIAATPAEWKRAYLQSCCPEQADLTFSQMYRLLFSRDTSTEQLQILSRLSTLSREVIFEGVGSLITEWYESDHGRAFGAPDLCDVALALARIHDHLLSPPDLVRAPNLRIRWHSMCMRLATCSQPRNFASNQQSRRDWFATPIGRRAVLHAIAIRLEVDMLSISYVRYPHVALLECPYQAALLLIAYIKNQDSLAVEGVANAGIPYNVETPVHWSELGTCALVSNITNELWTVPPTPAGYYLQWGGRPLFHGAPINRHALVALVNTLRAMGQTWRRSGLLAKEIENQIM